MEEAYLEDINENIENDIFSLWLHSYNENATDEFKILDLSKRFNCSTKRIIEVIKEDLNNDYLKLLSSKELTGIYATLNKNNESISNKIQMEIIKTILDDRNN